jgi:hypothetical protein
VVAGTFQSRLDSQLAHRPLTPQTRAAVSSLRNKPLVVNVSTVPPPQRPVVRHALLDASVYAFHIGIAISGGLAIVGGLVALVGIQNPRRRVPSADCPGGPLGINPEAAPRAVAAGAGGLGPVPAQTGA